MVARQGGGSEHRGQHLQQPLSIDVKGDELERELPRSQREIEARDRGEMEVKSRREGREIAARSRRGGALPESWGSSPSEKLEKELVIGSSPVRITCRGR